MQAATLDVLEAADFPPAQARAIVTAIDHEVSAKIETLATKQQLADSAASVDRRFDWVKAEFDPVRLDIANLRAEVARWLVIHLLTQLGALLGGAWLIARVISA